MRRVRKKLVLVVAVLLAALWTTMCTHGVSRPLPVGISYSGDERRGIPVEFPIAADWSNYDRYEWPATFGAAVPKYRLYSGHMAGESSAYFDRLPEDVIDNFVAAGFLFFCSFIYYLAVKS